MTDERVVDENVTKFLLSTCRVRPRLGKHAAEAAIAYAAVARIEDDIDIGYIPLTTGSMAELYIEPMLPHIGDIDIMAHPCASLVILEGHPPPTQLPAEYHDYVDVFEITDSDLSGYVYAKLRCLLTKCADTGRYTAVEHHMHGAYLSLYRRDGIDLHGPAYQYLVSEPLPIDMVGCFRCLSWPPQAGSWPLRPRNYGWPDSATVHHVISDGCDVVQIAHHQCRQDEWMKTRQWRLSFSRAEIVLMNSWTPVQQIVYHLLRVFAKTNELLIESTLSNYNIKTLMLWASELKPNSWWTDNLSFVRICAELLHTLAVWLTETRCKHYFLNSCNLVEKSFALETIASRLRSIDRECLSSWFVSSYFKESVQICPGNISRLFDDVSTTAKLANAVSAVVEWRLNTPTMDMWRVFGKAKNDIIYQISTNSFTARSVDCWMTELSKIDVHLSVYFIAVAFVHVARKLSGGSLSENLMKVIAVSTSQFVVSSNCCNARTLLLLNEVIGLVREYRPRNSADNNIDLVDLLQQSAVELLTTVRHYEAREFGSVVETVTTDFEALYAYKRGDYQRCLQLSVRNIRSLLFAPETNNSQTSDPERVQADIWIFPESLQLMDDDMFSLNALTLIVNPECRREWWGFSISQLTLSLYLMTQCKLKLRHSMESLAVALECIVTAQKAQDVSFTLDQLTLKLIERKLVTCIQNTP